MMFNLAEFGRGCAKALLLVLNMIIILMALSCFAFVVIEGRILKQYGEGQATGMFVGDIIVIVISVLLMILAIFGCVGAVRENDKILYLYVGFLMILVIIELLVGIFMSVQRYGLEFSVTDWIREDFFKNVTGDDVVEHRKLWDDLQISYECCGLNGPDDYPAIAQPISMACCPRAFNARSLSAQDLLYKACLESKSYYNEGCEDEILFALREGTECLLGYAVICFWLEAAGMLLAMWVANNLRKDVTVQRTCPFLIYCQNK